MLHWLHLVASVQSGPRCSYRVIKAGYCFIIRLFFNWYPARAMIGLRSVSERYNSIRMYLKMECGNYPLRP